jgi:hypothetical protein
MNILRMCATYLKLLRGRSRYVLLVQNYESELVIQLTRLHAEKKSKISNSVFHKYYSVTFFIHKLTLLTCYLPITTTFVKLLLWLDLMSKDLKQRCDSSFCKTVPTMLSVY